MQENLVTKPAESLVDLRVREGLQREAVVLIADGAAQAAPMGMPPGAWGLLVTAVDRSAADGEVLLFAGTWCEQDFESTGFDGDLVVQLQHAGDGPDDSDAVEVRMLTAEGDGWEAVRTWPRLDRTWPATAGAEAATVLADGVDSTPIEVRLSPPLLSGKDPDARLSVRDLVAVGALAVGEELVYERPRLGLHRTARVTSDGKLRLDDGQVFATPCGATTALGSPHQNGWYFWSRVSDGRPLFQIRACYAEVVYRRRASEWWNADVGSSYAG
ncbi:MULTISPECIES: hypothetical protein [Amycolatopsis]|uniref:RAMA domain-containing protein n=2 Tax=Amycolatopsis TaxID=1813 RepID=A0A1I4AJQ1_9PSEU|nr:hypothetical protein [Amycolatopsis sacchari]SFK56161.1 hypothetical protein SAMN05421835_12432 [Amycolatopsis sacchari]